MSEIGGQPPEEGPEDGQPLETAAQQAVYDGPIEKFKGKTAAEIAQTYLEVESLAKRKDEDIKARDEKLQGYEQWYRSQQAQQQTPPVPQTPPDIYDNPQAFVQHAAQPLIEKAVEQTKFQNALSMAPIMKNQAKQNYPEVFDGVDEAALEKIMYNGVRTGTVHYSALADENAWKMAAWQMKGDSTGYKAGKPQPVNLTQSEQPSGGTHEGGPIPMSKEAMDMAMALGKDQKTAQKLWEARQKKEAK